MSAALPASGPEREIFIAALRYYSDTCEAPLLQADCPFATLTDPETRGCGEECIDLLATHHADAPQGRVWLGDGWAMHPRRRPRRGPGPMTKPYDAKEIYFQDRDAKEIAAWSTPAVMYELRYLLSSSPAREVEGVDGDRRARLNDCIAELERRAFDAELVVREGMGNVIAVNIALAVVMPTVVRDSDPEAPELEMLEPPPGWEELFDLVFASDSSGRFAVGAPDSFVRLVAATSGDFHRRVAAWVLNASLDDVLDWRAPTYDTLVEYPPTDFAQIPPTYEWIVERALNTYISEWSTPSLHAEWEYVHGERIPPCPPKEMATRRVDAGELAREIAQRAVSATPERRALEAGLISPEHYVTYAARLIHEGRRGTAAAIFEATREVSPLSATAHNNYGFCILPDRPEDALIALEQAQRLGDSSAVNTGNRILALMKLGRSSTAIEVGERFAERFEETPETYGWMWDFTSDSDDPELLELEDVRPYVLNLVVHVAESTQDDALIGQWNRRRADLLKSDE